MTIDASPSTPAIALFGINMGGAGEPTAMIRIAQAAEAAGYESVWTGEHIVLPDPQARPSPAPPQTNMVDTAVALSFIAAATSTIKLGSGIIILPQRHAAVLLERKHFADENQMVAARVLAGVAAGKARRRAVEQWHVSGTVAPGNTPEFVAAGFCERVG